MAHTRIPEDHPLVLKIKKEDADSITWVPYALAILAGIDVRDEYRYEDLADLCGVSEIIQPVLTAAIVLSGWPDAVFDVCCHTMHLDMRAPVPQADMLAVLNGEEILHPITGKPFEEAAKHCFLTYKVRDGL